MSATFISYSETACVKNTTEFLITDLACVNSVDPTLDETVYIDSCTYDKLVTQCTVDKHCI